MGDSRVQVDAKNSSTLTPGFKPEESSFLKQRYQDQIEEETTSPTAEKQFSTSGQATPTPPPSNSPPVGHSFGRVSVRPIQTKLTIGQPNDKYEQEADRVAEQVMRMPDPRSPAVAITRPVRAPLVQRLCTDCDEELQRQPLEEGEDEEKMVQAKAIAGLTTPVIKRQEAEFEEEEEAEEEGTIQAQALPGHMPPIAIDARKQSKSPFTGHSFGQIAVRPLVSPRIQTKLTIGQPNDKYEQEADRVAEQVMRMPDPRSPTVAITRPVRAPLVQRLCTDCDEELQRQPLEEGEEETEESLHTKAASSKMPRVTPAIEYHLNASRKSGLPLPEQTRSFMEPRFGNDFSQVRVHTDTSAKRAAQSLNAQAFTHGNHIYFGSGYYQPHTRAGKRLLAHEITHVVQQTGGVQLKSPIPNQSNTEALKANDRSAKDSLILWRFIQTKLDLNSTNSSLEEEETPTIQATYSQCAEEEQIQRQPTEDDTIQASFWDDLESTVSSGAEWVAEQGEDLLEMGAEAFMEIIERIAPGLAELIRNGPEGLLSEKIGTGIQAWLQDFLGDFDIGSAVSNLQESLAEVFANIQGALAGDEASCAAFAEGINSLRELATAFMENPAVQAIQEAFAKVGDVLQEVSNLVLAPVFDALMEVAGGIFDGVRELASTIWEWGGRVRDFLGRAWDWVLEQLGIGGDSEGGILDWLKEQASAVWDQIKETFAPVIEPLKTVLTVLVAFSPVGPFLAAVMYGPQIIEAVQWLWNNKDNPDIVKAAHEQMGNTILPQLLSAAQGFSEALQSAATSLINQVVQISEGVLQLLGSITGVPLLSIAQNLIQTISTGIQDFATWCQNSFKGAVDAVKSMFAKIQKVVAPYAEVLTSLALAVVNPGMIPVILAGWAWRAMPDCYKPPIIDFLLDAIIGILQALPNLPMMGPLWLLLKTGVIGFLEGVKSQNDAKKIEVTNKLAKIISGASPAFMWGFVKGLLKGIWEGITDPFVLIFTAIKGLGSLIQWLHNTANSALGNTAGSSSAATPSSAPSEPSTASQATSENLASEPSGASSEIPAEGSSTGGTIPPAERQAIGQRMQAMGAELQPDVEQVTGGFMPAVEETFSGGESITYEQLVQKLGEAWDAVQNTIRNAGKQLADKVFEFLLQDEAEGKIGEGVGWLAGTIAFEVVLGILTAGTITAAKGVMKVVKIFAKVLDWTGEVMGLAFKALAKLGGYVMDAVRGIGKLLNNAGGAVRTVMDALRSIGEKVIRFANELLGRVGRGAASEAAERTARETAEVSSERAAREAAQEAAERTSREAAEVGTERSAREAAEEGAEEAAERGAREAAEESGEKGARRTADDARKAAELPLAMAEARAITETNDVLDTPTPILVGILNATVKPRYSWLDRFDARFEGKPGHYSIHLIASDNIIKKDYTDIYAELDDIEDTYESVLRDYPHHLKRYDEIRRLADQDPTRAAQEIAGFKQDIHRLAGVEAPSLSTVDQARRFGTDDISIEQITPQQVHSLMGSERHHPFFKFLRNAIDRSGASGVALRGPSGRFRPQALIEIPTFSHQEMHWLWDDLYRKAGLHRRVFEPENASEKVAQLLRGGDITPQDIGNTLENFYKRVLEGQHNRELREAILDSLGRYRTRTGV